MLPTNNDELAGRLIEAIDEINPERLKSVSHGKYSSKIEKFIKHTLSQDGTALMVVTHAIKNAPNASYKQGLLVEVLYRLLSAEENLQRCLLYQPFGAHQSRRNLWKEHANTIITIPDLIGNCHLLKDYPYFVPNNYFKELSRCILSVLQRISQCTSVQPIDEQGALLMQVLGRIAISNKELLWINFTSKAFRMIKEDESFAKVFKEIFRLPLKDSSIVGNFDQFLESLYLPIFHNLIPTSNSGREIFSLLGGEAVTNDNFHYLICDKSILRTNFNIDRLRQKVLLFNIFSYLSYLDELQQNDKSSMLIDTLHNILISWSSGTRILLRSHEHNRYITWALLLGFRFALAHHKDSLGRRAREYQSIIANCIPIYLSRSDNVQRGLGLYVAELIMPDLHNLLMETKDQMNSKEELQFPRLVQPEKRSPDHLEASQLYKGDFTDIFDQINKFTPVTESESKEHTLVDSLKSCKNHDRKKSQEFKDTKVVDSDENDSKSSEEDENFGDEVNHVPIYLRDCVEGLRDRNATARYARLCLAKANELVEKFSSDRKELDTIRDVGIELAQTTLFMENQFNLSKFEVYREKILSSLCCAKPELIAYYLLEQFNSPNRSIRQQLDILQALVSSAEKLSSVTSVPMKGVGRINGFAKFAPLYFYGICNRLKLDLNNDIADLITPQPSSVLSAFRELEDVDSANSLKDAESILKRAIKMEEERESVTNRHDLKATRMAVESRAVNDRVLELDSVSDDSYLLSKILNSISVIIKCTRQQPILCRLSNDLLQILKAYRCHPDLGVQKSIVTCLKSIQDCTPEVYFKESLEKQMVKQFGAWLESKALTQ